MPKFTLTIILALLFALTQHLCADDTGNELLMKQVADTERAFAQTMADRDFAAFQTFLAEEAVFFAGENVLRGKQQVAEAWAGLYEGENAPFSWSPESVVVLDSGELALSSGPVLDPQGKPGGTFTSIWRLDASGHWKIVFDKGNPACDCTRAETQTADQ